MVQWSVVSAEQAPSAPAEARVGTGGPVRRAWRRQLVAWSCHGVLYLALAAASVGALLSATRLWPVTVLLAAAFGGWYGYWNLRAFQRLERSGAALLAYLLVGTVLWIGLLAVDRGYGVVGVVMVAQLFGYLDWRVALGVVTAVVTVTVLASGVQGSLGGPLNWQGMSLGAVTGTAAVFGLVALCVYLDRQVAAARAELATEQRRAGVLAERGRLAADLHDTLTQNLASIVLLLEAARTSYRDGAPETAVTLDRALTTARSGLHDVRGLVWDLRPEALEQQTLHQAVATVADRLAGQAGIAVRTEVTGDPRRLPAGTETALLRMAEEALANVRRHSRAREATVTLSYIGDVVALDVTDDGAGFDPTVSAVAGRDGGLGLATMHERVAAVGGSLTVESAPGAGTSVAAQVPVA